MDGTVIGGSLISSSVGGRGDLLGLHSNNRDGSVLDPVVNSGLEDLLEDDHTDGGTDVENGPENVDSGTKSASVGSLHDEAHGSHPVESKDADVSHVHGTDQSSASGLRVFDLEEDPGDGKGCPGRGEHVDHSLMVFNISTADSYGRGGGSGRGSSRSSDTKSASEAKVHNDRNVHEDISHNAVDHETSLTILHCGSGFGSDGLLAFLGKGSGD